MDMTLDTRQYSTAELARLYKSLAPAVADSRTELFVDSASALDLLGKLARCYEKSEQAQKELILSRPALNVLADVISPKDFVAFVRLYALRNRRGFLTITLEGPSEVKIDYCLNTSPS